MAVPRLGRDPISIEEANRIYEDAQLLFRRYDPNASIDASEVGAGSKVDPNNYAVRSSDTVISVVRGNVFDRDLVIKDMTRLSALRGQIGEIVVDLEMAHTHAKKVLGRIEGRLYNKYTSAAYSEGGVPELANVPKTKITKDNLSGLVANDQEHANAEDVLVELERNKKRAKEAQDGLIDLENELKKALEHGEKAQ